MEKTFPFAKSVLVLSAFIVVIGFSQVQMRRIYTLPYPPLTQLIKNKHSFQDAAFIAVGFRRLGADVAWIQLLQTMGDFGHVEEIGREYPRLKDDTLRVTRIDPYFRKAYLFGAATLAWLRTVNRPEEALEVLGEGIHYNPRYWQFRMYVAGIGYKMRNQIDKMVVMLEDAAREPECPTTVKSVLANTYKLQKRYAEAIAIWEMILATPSGRDYHDRARSELPVLRELLNESRQQPS